MPILDLDKPQFDHNYSHVAEIVSASAFPDLSRLIEASEITTQPLKLLVETVSNTYIKPLEQLSETLGNIVETQNQIFAKLASQISFKNVFLESMSFPATIVDAEEIEIGLEEFAPITKLPLALPAPTSNKSRMGLKQISGGNFKHKNKTLIGLSTSNREGKLLAMLLKNSDLFVSDELIDNTFLTEDILGRSDLMRLLKNKFKKNKLTLEAKRQGDGYILLSVKPFYAN